MFTQPTRYLGDRTVWMNPVDAQRLGIRNGDMAEIEGIDTKYVGQARITVTKKVVPGGRFRLRLLRRQPNETPCE